MKRIACFVAFWLTLSTPVFAQWTPPVGVPIPPFGVNEVTPAPTVWVNQQTGSDANLGTQAKPRYTIPLQLAAGTVVNVTGTYATSHTSPNTIEAHGTVSKPVYITGKAIYTTGGELTGSYLVLEQGSGPGYWEIQNTRGGKTTDHPVIRDYDSTGGFGSVSYIGVPNTDIVFLRVNVHDAGDINAGEEGRDHHGFGIGKWSQRVWILDSNASRNSGDGVQINGEQGGQLNTGPVYIGRFTCVHNRQTCAWAKQSHDVTFSNVTASGFRPDKDYTNPGACVGGQYYVIHLIIYGLDCSDSDNGINIAGYDDAAYKDPEAGVGIFSSKIYNIHSKDHAHDPNNPRSPGGAIIFAGGSQRLVQDTTIDDVDGAIMVQSGTFQSVNNKITRAGDVGSQPPPVITPVPPVTPKPPTPPRKPSCQHTALGALGYIFGRCIW